MTSYGNVQGKFFNLIKECQLEKNSKKRGIPNYRIPLLKDFICLQLRYQKRLQL
jgi:hypothetical protein